MNSFQESDSVLISILALAEKSAEIAVMWLYGSRAEETFSKHSDYDIAVAFIHFIKLIHKNEFVQSHFAICFKTM